MAMPMQKHPIKLTSIIPVGNVKKCKFFIKSLMANLKGAPKAPPHAIKKNLVIMMLTLFHAPPQWNLYIE